MALKSKIQYDDDKGTETYFLCALAQPNNFNPCDFFDGQAPPEYCNGTLFTFAFPYISEPQTTELKCIGMIPYFVKKCAHQPKSNHSDTKLPDDCMILSDSTIQAIQTNKECTLYPCIILSDSFVQEMKSHPECFLIKFSKYIDDRKHWCQDATLLYTDIDKGTEYKYHVSLSQTIQGKCYWICTIKYPPTENCPEEYKISYIFKFIEKIPTMGLFIPVRIQIHFAYGNSKIIEYKDYPTPPQMEEQIKHTLDEHYASMSSQKSEKLQPEQPEQEGKSYHNCTQNKKTQTQSHVAFESDSSVGNQTEVKLVAKAKTKSFVSEKELPSFSMINPKSETETKTEVAKVPDSWEELPIS